MPIPSSEIRTNLVELLRSIPDLVAEMDGDFERIFGYEGDFARRFNSSIAVHQMPCPGVMVMWQGVGVGSFGGFEAWKQRFSIYVRASSEESAEKISRLLLKGVPSGSPQPLLYTTVHPSCHPMDLPGDFERRTDAEGVDYFELPVTLTEIGDE